MKKISVLGSTGSIGTQALEVCEENGFVVTGLAAKSNINLLIEQTKKYSPKIVCIFNEDLFDRLSKEVSLINPSIKVVCGMQGLIQTATEQECDIVLNSVVGMIGLEPTLAAINAKKDIALANKETLVVGGEIVIQKAKDMGVNIYPVDSEHSAIFQSIQGCSDKSKEIKKIILTASGGPFFGKTKDELKDITKKDALKHPNWDMGAKITIDSATLMNKGLEFIEAAWLFNLTADDIEVVVHRESVVHSAVEFIDNSVIAQLGVPDMKLPIQYALTYPNRVQCNTKSLSLTDYATLSFYKPDYDTFDCLSICIKAFRAGKLKPAIVNGANEQAVELFLQDKIKFLDIGELVSSAFDNVDLGEDAVFTIENIYKADRLAREFVLDIVGKKPHKC